MFALSKFIKIDPTTFTALGTLLGFIFMDQLNANAMNSLGNFLMLIAQVLETAANQEIYLQGLRTNSPLSTTSLTRTANAPSSSSSTTTSQTNLEAELAQLRQEIEALKAMLGKSPS